MFLPPDRLRPAFMFLNKTSALGGAPWCPLHRLATDAELVGLCHLSGVGMGVVCPIFSHTPSRDHLGTNILSSPAASFLFQT